MRAAEVAPDVLFGVGALPVAEHGDAPPLKCAEPCEHRLVIAEVTIPVKLDDVVEEGIDVVLGLGRSGWRDICTRSHGDRCS